MAAVGPVPERIRRCGSNRVGLNAIRDQEISTRSYGSLNMFRLEEEKWYKL